MNKKLISLILSAAILLSVFTIVVPVYAAGSAENVSAVDSDERYIPSEGTKTHRLYFAMPESWKNAKFGADTAGAYWWGGTDACGSLDGASVGNAWPGYKIQVADADANLFFVDLPDDVPVVIFNNFLNGGERKTDEDGNVTYEFGEEQFKAANQTMDISCQYVSDGDDDLYDNLLGGDFWSQAEKTLKSSDKTFFGNFEKNFFMDPDFNSISFSYDNMVYVIDPTNVDVSSISGKKTYGGNFYFFYGPNEETGKYEYGELPNYEMAKENGLVKEIEPKVKPTEDPTSPTTEPPIVGAGNTIKFNVKKSGWNNVKTVFCHVWKADGTGNWTAWQSKKEKCKYDSSTGIATYDLSLTGNKFKKTDGKIYCVIFSANTGMQTYNAIMSGKCIGDTLYCTGQKIENPEDSEKKSNVAVWTKNKDCGPERKITSTGKVVGTAFPEGENDTTMMATYLIAYYNDSAKTKCVPTLLKKLNLKSSNVMKAVDTKLVGNPKKDEIRPAIKKILDKVPDPTPNNIKPQLKLNKTSLTLGVNQTYTLYVLLKTHLGEAEVSNAKWFSSNRSVVTVNSKGKLTAKKAGTAKINVQDSEGRVVSCKVTVKKAPTSVKLNAKTATMGAGQSAALKATLSKGSAGSVSWATSNKKVATVAKNGKVVAKGVGTATITVKTYNGKKATCKITVKKAPKSVKLSKTAITLKKGKTYTLKATLSSGSAGSKSWTTSNKKVAIVNSKGVVTTKAKGTAYITVKTYNGKTAKCKVVVK